MPDAKGALFNASLAGTQPIIYGKFVGENKNQWSKDPVVKKVAVYNSRQPQILHKKVAD